MSLLNIEPRPRRRAGAKLGHLNLLDLRARRARPQSRFQLGQLLRRPVRDDLHPPIGQVAREAAEVEELRVAQHKPAIPHPLYLAGDEVAPGHALARRRDFTNSMTIGMTESRMIAMIT